MNRADKSNNLSAHQSTRFDQDPITVPTETTTHISTESPIWALACAKALTYVPVVGEGAAETLLSIFGTPTTTTSTTGVDVAGINISRTFTYKGPTLVRVDKTPPPNS